MKGVEYRFLFKYQELEEDEIHIGAKSRQRKQTLLYNKKEEVYDKSSVMIIDVWCKIFVLSVTSCK